MQASRNLELLCNKGRSKSMVNRNGNCQGRESERTPNWASLHILQIRALRAGRCGNFLSRQDKDIHSETLLQTGAVGTCRKLLAETEGAHDVLRVVRTGLPTQCSLRASTGDLGEKIEATFTRASDIFASRPSRLDEGGSQRPEAQQQHARCRWLW